MSAAGWGWRVAWLMVALSLWLPTPVLAEGGLGAYKNTNARLGGEFTLKDQHGNTVTLAALNGRVVLLAFGFTHCPDICPVTAANMARVLSQRKEKRSRLRMVFVTVDPERDTPQRLKVYLEYFHPGIMGLTGSLEHVEDMAQAFLAAFKKQQVASAAGYLVGHSSLYYLLDQQGRVRYIFPHGTRLALILSGIDKLLNSKP